MPLSKIYTQQELAEVVLTNQIMRLRMKELLKKHPSRLGSVFANKNLVDELVDEVYRTTHLSNLAAEVLTGIENRLGRCAVERYKGFIEIQKLNVDKKLNSNKFMSNVVYLLFWAMLLTLFVVIFAVKNVSPDFLLTARAAAVLAFASLAIIPTFLFLHSLWLIREKYLIENIQLFLDDYLNTQKRDEKS